MLKQLQSRLGFAFPTAPITSDVGPKDVVKLQPQSPTFIKFLFHSLNLDVDCRAKAFPCKVPLRFHMLMVRLIFVAAGSFRWG
eukprot:2006064-Amphidinium_carterae.1